MKDTYKCPVCSAGFLVHGNAALTTLRDHIRENHPEEHAELRRREKEINEARAELVRDFPNCCLFR